MSATSVYKTEIPEGYALEREAAVTRWSVARLAEVQGRLLDGAALPDWVGRFPVWVGGHEIKLFDLRGANFTGVDFSDKDLSYCALDFADLSFTKLNGTRLQYSRLRDANCFGAQFEKTQASPIDASGADFSGATIANSFFMHANLFRVKFDRGVIKGNAFLGAELGGVSVDDAIGEDLLQIVPRVELVRSTVIVESTGSTRKEHARVDTQESSKRRQSTLLATLKRSVAELTRSPVTVYHQKIVVGTVVASSDHWVEVQAVRRVSPTGSKRQKSGRVYKAKSLANWYTVGDKVELVAYRAEPVPVAKGRRYYAKSSRVADTPLGKPKTKTNDWLVAKVLTET